ncbi:MAG: arginine--tRNA ligase [Saprospiraceae bacterium]|nr:arginine--tRNA ligase [Saprospiraceae bacterium]
MFFYKTLHEEILRGINESLFAVEGNFDVILNETKKEFEGHVTFVVFPLVKQAGKSPEVIGETLGNWLINNSTIVEKYNVVKGFLNLSLKDSFWLEAFSKIQQKEYFSSRKPTGEKVLVEYSSPNTNKPLHLGHIRNILLGWSVSKILEFEGNEVVTTQVINDRGIAICKSMLAWKKWGEGKTPETTGIKGDHFVGDFYVKFEQEFVKEYTAFSESEEGGKIYLGQKKENQEKTDFFKVFKNTYFNEFSPLGAEARNMLLEWEAGANDTIQLWKQMNGWVYEGFDTTYKTLGVSFDSVYYESETYILGKKVVEEGLVKGVFYRLPDSSVWIDLEDAGMDKKIVLRSDGTSVYITQDIGTAIKRYEDFGAKKMIYTVADEQDYHFKVLFEIAKRLGEPFADGLFHLSYGMVDLPTGKMKSREGTVVDADDLIAEVISEAKLNAGERGELAHMTVEEQENIFYKIGLGAIKFFIIKVQPQKRMIFDPKESVDMQGATGPYIQNAFVIIQSLFRKSDSATQNKTFMLPETLNEGEKTLIQLLMSFPEVISNAAKQYEPSGVANYAYTLAKEFHKYYHETRILSAETASLIDFRLSLSKEVANALQTSLNLLGIEMPDRM